MVVEPLCYVLWSRLPFDESWTVVATAVGVLVGIDFGSSGALCQQEIRGRFEALRSQGISEANLRDFRDLVAERLW